MSTRIGLNEETKIACRYNVMLLKLADEGWITRKFLVAKFAAKGDAIAYAIHRAHSLPADRAGFDVFEVETPNAIHCLYRAG